MLPVPKTAGKRFPGKTLDKTATGWEAIEKALTHKYIRRIPKKSGKGWYYIYQEDFQKPILALKTFFGFKEEKITEDYEQHKIHQAYGVDKKTFAAHVLEYLTNKIQWDTFFAQKEHRVKYDRPQKMGTVKQVSDETVGSDAQGELFDQKKKPADSKDKEMTLNRSLMRKIWSIFNKEEEKTDGTNRTGTEQRKLPAGAAAVRAGGSKAAGDQHVPRPKAGDNRGEPLQLPFEFGERTGRAVRLTKQQAKDIRGACLDLLKTKKDTEMTEADKALLRQYEGAGGLGSEDASVHGTLYEFYTPRTVTKKVWDIVDKYLPGAKKVLEPSAGIGRFAEDRPLDHFTLNEYDQTASRISGILHPEADVQQGAFQELFKPGKAYAGKQYDVVIGNPPYGAYEGLWKGKGEGKEHTRYEEYFIDRGLDTLREGGIMAFVVPSSFLRNGKDKIKEKIAAKGKLMEAWRLPNGTFNTTGVGTDIIIIRKETGDAAAFSDNAYFKDNPGMVVGEETTRKGRFGEEQYVALSGDDTFDSAIERIKADAVEAVPLGDKTAKEEAQEKVAVKESEAEAHANRSAAMRGNQNAKKEGAKSVEKQSGIDALKRLANGEDVVKNAMHRPELETMGGTSGISFYWGEGGKIKSDGQYRGGYGFKKILEKHGIEDALKVIDTIANGEIGKPYGVENGKRVDIVNKDHQTTISLYKDKKSESWVLTGFTIDENTDAKGRSSDLTSATQTSPIRTRADLGAVLSSVSSKTPEKSSVEPHRSRSEAMLGNQNAAGPHEVDTAAEFNAKYNKHIAPEALPVWKATQWNGAIDLSLLDKQSRDYLEKSGNYVKTATGQWLAVVNFVGGNLYDKLDQLERDKDLLSKTEYARQKALLESALPPPKTVLEFEVSPLSTFADTFITSETRNLGNSDEPMPLKESFKRWISRAAAGELALTTDASALDIISYVEGKRVTAARGKTEMEKEANRAEAARKITARREAAERLFNQFIRERLSLEDQKRLAETYNRQYNGTAQADYAQIPVFLDGISKTFKGEAFRANETQMKGVSWLANQGNGIVAFDVGVGKMLDNDEPVLTPDGWKRNGDLKEGDFVIAIDGTPTKVLKVFPHKNKPIYKMTFSDGSYSLCGDEHLWEVQRANERTKYPDKWRTMTTLDIKADIDKTRRWRQWSIPMCEPVQFPKRELRIAPYLMGALIGNGGFSNKQCMFTSADDFTIEKVKSLLPESVFLKFVDNYDYRLVSKEPQKGNEIASAMEVYGLRGHLSFSKFIPDDYLFSCIEDRIELLHGLMDTDGTVGGGNHGTPIYYTTSRELADDVKELVESLGGTATISEKQGKYKKDGETIICRMCYSVTIRLNENPFSLPRKADLYKAHTKYFPSRFIDGIEYHKNADATCILVEHPRHLYITRDYIVTHNTITAIMAAVNDLQMGRCKKPVICVPKAVYKNWVSEIAQIFPYLKINALGNFSDIGTFKDETGNLQIEAGSISLCTYEALTKIGFKDETLTGELAESFTEALSKTDEESSKRQKDQDSESIMTKVGMASRTGDNWVNWEDAGFDHITVDEAHNFRNSFSKPRNKDKGDADEFRDVPGGSTSLRGLKLFAITQMIQKHNNGRNVHLLTATPFQNSPVEIYNMLSLVAREQLKQAGIYNFHEFLTQFAELKSEIAVDSKNNMVQKNVMKGFKNLSALQSLLNRYCMKVDGEDAGIIRPDKTDHIIELNQTAEQRDITEKIRAYMEAGPNPERDPGGTLRCINALRSAALSPTLVNGFTFLDPLAKSLAGIPDDSITVQKKDFVKDSPKMTFVCNTAVSLYKQHPDKGQIIHLPQGVAHYGKVKEYLVSQGIPADTIAFLAPEYLKAGDAGNDQKEEITRAFNDPANKLKIIIGSDTIKEGVNLNGNTIQTYECMLAWNPTDTQQLKGRSWRQGNKQGMVHITFPLMNDSVDSFMYQKHDEKGSRLDTLWNAKQEKIDVDGIDPEELKFSLIKDPKKRADLFIKEKTANLKQRQKIAVATSDKIFTMSGERKKLIDEIEDYQKDIDRLKQSLSGFNAKTDAAIIKEHELDFNAAYGRVMYDDFVSGVRGNTITELRANYNKEIKELIADAQKTMQRNKGKIATIDNTLNRYGIEAAENMATVERVRKQYSDEALKYTAQIAAIEGNRDQYIREAAAQIQQEAKPGVSVGEAVARNTQDVSGNLYAMDVVKERVLTERGIKKSLVVLIAKNIAVKVERRDA